FVVCRLAVFDKLRRVVVFCDRSGAPSALSPCPTRRSSDLQRHGSCAASPLPKLVGSGKPAFQVEVRALPHPSSLAGQSSIEARIVLLRSSTRPCSISRTRASLPCPEQRTATNLASASAALSWSKPVTEAAVRLPACIAR